jgi:hypothetical protein
MANHTPLYASLTPNISTRLVLSHHVVVHFFVESLDRAVSTAAAAGLAGTLNGGATLGASVVVVVDERLHLGVDIKRCV